MAIGSLITNNGKKIHLYRAYTQNADLSATQYLPASKFQIGKDQGTPAVTDTALTIPIPISDGTVNDAGDNTLTGSSGGDNSTDNTVTFKEGAGESDDTAQNLIANNTNVTKIWTIADLSSAGTLIDGSQPFGLWFYIIDATALAKFLTSGTALRIKLGSDSSNYYSYTRTAAQLAVGWNWISSGSVNVEDLTETGTVTGNIDTFIINIITNNATDEFVAGDIVYDLLRQWEASDLIKSYNTDYPTIDLSNLEVTSKMTITGAEANGFDFNSLALFNIDATPLMQSLHTFDEDSKSSSDEFIFTVKNREL